MVLVGVVYVIFFPSVTSGPLWTDHAPDYSQCKSYWWANLLLVQNFLQKGVSLCFLFTCLSVPFSFFEASLSVFCSLSLPSPSTNFFLPFIFPSFLPTSPLSTFSVFLSLLSQSLSLSQNCTLSHLGKSVANIIIFTASCSSLIKVVYLFTTPLIFVLLLRCSELQLQTQT